MFWVGIVLIFGIIPVAFIAELIVEGGGVIHWFGIFTIPLGIIFLLFSSYMEYVAKKSLPQATVPDSLRWPRRILYAFLATFFLGGGVLLFIEWMLALLGF